MPTPISLSGTNWAPRKHLVNVLMKRQMSELVLAMQSDDESFLMVDIRGHPAGCQQMGEPGPLRGRAGRRVRPRAIDNALTVFHGKRTYPSSCLLCWVGCPPSSDHTGISASVWGLFSPQ